MGGLLEHLRHRNQQEAIAAIKEAERILYTARKQQFERERVLNERAKNMPQWEKAKTHFNESGLLAIFKEVIGLKRAESYYVDPENFGEMLYWKWDVGTPHFSAELHIETTVKEHDEHYYVGGYSNKITTKYVGIRTDKDGTISFHGKRGPFSFAVKVPKTKWQGNVEVLEDALGRVYRHPLTSERREMINNSLFDRFAGLLEREIKRENEEPEA